MSRPLPDPELPWAIALEGVAEIADSEGLRLKAYRCPAGVWTIGWGETDGVHPGDTCTKEQADRWLCDDIATRARTVKAMCTVEPGEHELAAMVSLAYNIGTEGLRRSTVLRQHNAGDRQAAARAFGLWDKARDPATGELRVLDGLTARRAREAAMYLTPDGGRAEPMPQAVQAESSLVASPIARSGAATAAAGGLAGASAIAEQIDAAKGLLASARGMAEQVHQITGVPPLALLGIALVIVGWVVVSTRAKQRAGGWA
jgi:lysozyme